jgi:dethiobiotin synthetase
MARGIFITGTDTGVGKTLVSCAFIHACRSRGLKVAGMKPVASGSRHTPHGLRNADALALQQVANVAAEYATVNPYCFAPAIAPHLAARQVAVAIELSTLEQAYRLLGVRAQVVIVEGAGGWRVPLEPRGYLSDFAEALQLDVVLVVGLRLGCINHALLTAEAIQAGSCRLVGWVGNVIDPDFAPLQDNLATLAERLTIPCLGVLPHNPTADAFALSGLIDLGCLSF